MIPEREQKIRKECEECLNERVTFTDPPIECDHCRDKIDTLDALDAERAAHAETKAALEEVVMQPVRNGDAEIDLASACNLANSWAREMGVAEASRPAVTREVIDRLWSTISTRLSQQAAEIAGLRVALTAIRSNASRQLYEGRENITFLGILASDALAASPSDWETQARQVVEALRKLSHASQVGVPDHKKRECLYASGYDALATPFARLLGGGK